MYKNKEDNRKTIKEWEIETGIEIINPYGFWESKSKVWNKKYPRKIFRKGAKLSFIRIKTEKGLAFLTDN